MYNLRQEYETPYIPGTHLQYIHNLVHNNSIHTTKLTTARAASSHMVDFIGRTLDSISLYAHMSMLMN